MKVKIICRDCKSTDVARDAWAYWNFEKQEWDISSIFDEAYCFQCDASSTLVEAEPAEQQNDT